LSQARSQHPEGREAGGDLGQLLIGFGAISYSLFGHLHGVIEDDDALFALQVRRAGGYLLRGAG
jgi:hypothetical protein